MKSDKQTLSTCSERQDWHTFRNLGPGWDDMRVTPIAQFLRGDEIKIQAYISGCLVNVSAWWLRSKSLQYLTLVVRDVP